MRRLSLLLVLVSLALPGSALAADVEAGDFFFRPGYTRIDPGETVTWRFSGSPHTATSSPGAPAPFDSGELLPGQAFSFTFATAGRYPYLCSLHPFMRGVVQVGPDTIDPAIRRPKAKLGKKAVRVSFRLSEASTVSATVASAKRPKKVLRRFRARKVESAGALSVPRKGLAAGRYRVTLTAKDPEGNADKATVAFRLPAS